MVFNYLYIFNILGFIMLVIVNKGLSRRYLYFKFIYRFVGIKRRGILNSLFCVR